MADGAGNGSAIAAAAVHAVGVDLWGQGNVSKVTYTLSYKYGIKVYVAVHMVGATEAAFAGGSTWDDIG